MKTNRSPCLPILLLGLMVLFGSAARAESPVILVLGDSLSAGYGIPVEKGWVSLLQRRLVERGFPYRVVNASISGDTTSGGLSRLPAALELHRPAIVVLGTGRQRWLARSTADGDESQSVTDDRTIPAGRRAGVAGGDAYSAELWPPVRAKVSGDVRELAQHYAIPLIPFLLDGVAGNPALIQDDGLHPRAEAQPRILDNVWAVLEPALKS
ncbi:MAG: arylesterase [Candidatus Competibacteraceae bacterium]